MTNRSWLYVTVIGFTLLLTPACYTLLKHPRVKRVVYEEVTEKRCNTCHVEDEIWLFHHPRNLVYTDVPGYSAWTDYYEVPWWYNDYWYQETVDPVTIPIERSFRPGSRTLTSPGGRGTRIKPPATSPTSVDSPANNRGSDNGKQSKKRTVRPKRSKENGKKKKSSDDRN